METSHPTGWFFCRFGDIAQIRNGYAFKSSTFQKTKIYDSDVPLIKQSQLIGTVVNLSEAVYLPSEYLERYAGYVISKGDTLIGMSGAIGKMCRYQNDFPALQNQRTGKIEVFDASQIDSRFFGFYLSSVENELIRRAKGMGVQNISAKDIEALPLLLPPYNEQNEIVAKIEELFSELDNGVESLEKAWEQLKTYRQAVLKYAFEGKLTREWREQQIQAGNLSEPAERLLERIKKEREAHYEEQVEEWQKACEQAEKDGSKKPAKPKKPKDLPPLTEKELAELPELPDGWGWVKLGDILFSITAGKSFKCKEVPPKNDEIGVAKVSAVTWGEYNEIESKTCEDPSKLNTDYIIKEGDFLFSRANTIELVGASVIVKKTNLNVMLSDKTLRFTFNTANKLCILYYLRSKQGRSEIERLATGNQESMRNIGQDRIKQIILPFMSVEEQQAIVQEIETRLSVCDQLEQTIEDSLKKAEALRQSILKKAFEGELTKEWRKAHPELVSGENSAESLLARIREEKERLKGEGTKRRSGKMRKK